MKSRHNLLLGTLACLVAAAAPAQPTILSWSEETILAHDSTGALLVEGASAYVMVDADGDGPEWNLDYDAGLPAITVGDEGDYYATDAAGQIMPYDFQAGFMGLFAGKVIGDWTVDTTPSWVSDDLYLLLFFPGGPGGSGDEYGFSLTVPLDDWPNNEPLGHQIIGGGDIDPGTGTWHTVPLPGPGDVDRNGVVDGLDLTAVITAWDTIPGDPLWNPNADLDNNDIINGLDLTEVISNWTTGGAAVPEPASLALLGALAAALGGAVRARKKLPA